MTEAAPDVSVLVIAYNHELFIARALESVLMQRGVRIEVIVSEDCSTDGTLAIIRAAAAADDRVAVMASEQNLACNDTILRALRAARGRYVAMLDGDDMWIVDDKLARQVAMLDGDPSLAASFHNARVVLGDSFELEKRCWTAADHPPRIGMARIWEGNPFATAAGLLRRDALASIGDWYGELGRARRTTMITDWPLYIACAEHGDLAFSPEPVAAYRLHQDGVYSALPSRQKLDITAELYRRMDAGFGHRHHTLAAVGCESYFTGWMIEYGTRGETALAWRSAWCALRSGGIGRAHGWRRWLADAARALR
ncbi:MAG: glycosyltransferase family A protein [Sphingomicrobium sp.]